MTRRSDRFEVSVRGSDGQTRTLHAGVDFRVDLLNLSEALSLPMLPLERDLAWLAAAVYAVDRLERRSRLTPSRYPGREVEITCSVSDVAFWRKAADLVTQLLRFLGDDLISVRFITSHESDLWPIGRSLFPLKCDSVALFSGGLDSAAGLAAHLGPSDERIVSVTAEHQPHQRQRIQKQLSLLPSAIRSRVMPTFTRVTLLASPRISHQERTQRLRGFLFAALGGIVASRLGAEVVHVFENGVGAVNVPPIQGMSLGGLATRGAHPTFLRLMGRLVSTVAGRPIRFALPFKWMTKGEVVRSAVENGGGAALMHTVSCVHYPLRRRGLAKQCGLCPGCLEHQLARHVGGLPPAAFGFACDPLGLPLANAKADPLRLMVGQAYDFRQLRGEDVRSTFHDHLEQTGAITGTDSFERWTGLHVRHAEQVEGWIGSSRGGAEMRTAEEELVLAAT